jgi:hypothetical protein
MLAISCSVGMATSVQLLDASEQVSGKLNVLGFRNLKLRAIAADRVPVDVL